MPNRTSVAPSPVFSNGEVARRTNSLSTSIIYVTHKKMVQIKRMTLVKIGNVISVCHATPLPPKENFLPTLVPTLKVHWDPTYPQPNSNHHHKIDDNDRDVSSIFDAL
jgi:hypothetical protein